MNGYTIDAIVEISISCQMNNYTTGCAARELHMRAPLADLPLVCREYLKEASRCTIQAQHYTQFDASVTKVRELRGNRMGRLQTVRNTIQLRSG